MYFLHHLHVFLTGAHFFVWLLTVHFTYIWRVLGVAACISSSFLFNPEQHHIWVFIQMCVYHNAFIHLCVERLLVCFQFDITIQLLWTFIQKILCGYMLSFLLIKYVEVQWLGHMANVDFTLYQIVKFFSKASVLLYSLTCNNLELQCSKNCYLLPLSVFFKKILAILISN